MEFQHGFGLNDAYLRDIQAKHDAFNELCKAQLVEMNTNKINAIEDRAGDSGWEQHVEGDTLLALTKSFEFSSFEQGQAFVQEVSKYADEKDHHPEWRSEAGGTVIHVKLTSHFAGNTVSLLDYELAEAMNKAYGDTQSTFTMFPMFDQKQLLSLSVGLGMFVLCWAGFNYATMNENAQVGAQKSVSLPAPTKPAIVAADIEKVGVDAYVEENLHAHGYHEQTLLTIPKDVHLR